MCGRYSQLRSWSDLARLYNITTDQTPLNLPPRYNIAPTQDVPVVRAPHGKTADGSCC
jgi:putative SOS response-associated peptidase YedK